MTQKKILVTGGAGYIGAHTSLALTEAGYEPVIIDNLSRSDKTLLAGLENLTGRPPVFINGDCVDVTVLRRIFKDNGPIAGVMHFAALKSVGESVQIPLTYFQNNLQSLTSLLQVMGEFRVKDFIFSSSCTVYGQPDVIPVTELSPMRRAESPYGATKQLCERILEDVYPSGLRVISLRYFNPIGAHPSASIGEMPVGVPGNLVPFITQTAIGKRERLTVFGSDYQTPDGSCIRDYIHVMDLAKAHIAALHFLEGVKADNCYEAFNLGSGRGVSVLELIDKFIAVSGVKLNFVLGPRRPGDVERIYADPSKANKSLRWQTELTIEDALRDAWNWEKKLKGQAPGD